LGNNTSLFTSVFKVNIAFTVKLLEQEALTNRMITINQKPSKCWVFSFNRF